jgi:pyrimidine-nucleoside phosphorylase
MNFLSLIEAKREGKILSPQEIRRLIHAFTAGDIPDYQMAALLMAIYFRGLDTAETTALTLAMRDSGEVLKFPRDKRPLVDKHSTGGIGDKVSLPLAPLLACLGFRVPMISGRGLGITGGTLDKLDSIPGYKTHLSVKQIIRQVQKVGCVICGQTDTMVPADKKIYALRDATGTVPSIQLITASILSKKLAENLDALILDVKFGCAAFMPNRTKARRLAKAMIALGHDCGVKTHAILSNMNTPLGRAAGNWLEVKESVAVLDPSPERRNDVRADDLCTLVIDCAAHLLVQTGKVPTLAEGRKRTVACLDSGAPRAKWDEMIKAQGADLKAFNHQLAQDSTAQFVTVVRAGAAGYISRCDARIIGEAIRDLGGGRRTKESMIHFSVGMDHLVKLGERVEKSSILYRIHATNADHARAAVKQLKTAIAISPRKVKAPRLIQEILGQEKPG